MISSSVEGVFSGALDCLKKIKKGPPEFIQFAIDKIKEIDLTESEGTTHLSKKSRTEVSAEARLINDLILAKEGLFPLARLSGFESANSYLLKELEQSLWDSVQMVPIEKTSWIPFALGVPTPVKKMEILDKANSFLFSFLDLRLEGGESVEKARELGWLESPCITDSQKIRISKEEAQKFWPMRFVLWKSNYQRLKKEIEENAMRELFSPNPEERAEQYRTFCHQFYNALLVLSAKKEDYDFYDVSLPYILSQCKTGWESTAAELTGLTAEAPALKGGSLFSLIHNISQGLRKDVVFNRILPVSIERLNPELSGDVLGQLVSNVHYHKAVKQWSNQRYDLGFSMEELINQEPILEILSPHLEVVSQQLMDEFYSPITLITEIQKFYLRLSESDQLCIIDLLSDSYRTLLENGFDLYIDKKDSLRELYSLLGQIQNIEDFDEYAGRLSEIHSKFLKNGFLPLFSAKKPKEFYFAGLQESILVRAVVFKKDLKKELEKFSRIPVHEGGIDLEEQKRLYNLIIQYECSESPESKASWLVEKKKRIADLISNLDHQIILENVTLLKEMSKNSAEGLSSFGAALIGSFLKVLSPLISNRQDLPHKILKAFFEDCFPFEKIEVLVEKILNNPTIYLTLPAPIKNLVQFRNLVLDYPQIKYGYFFREYQQMISEIKSNPQILNDLGVEWQSDRNLILKIVKKKGRVLEFASADLKNDREVVLAAVSQFGGALEFASDLLKNDKEIVLVAIRRTGNPLRWASRAMRNDKELALKALSKSGFIFNFLSECLRNDREVVMAAIPRRGFSLWSIPESLRNDREVVLAAVRKSGTFLRYVSLDLRNDKEVVLVAVRQNVIVWTLLSDILKLDVDVLEATGVSVVLLENLVSVNV